MSQDLVKENLDFLESGRPFIFDKTDPDEQKLMSYNMSVGELMTITWIYSLRHEVVAMNKSLIVGVSGKHRAGKSLWAFAMGKILDPTFWPRYKQRVVQTPKQFMDEIEYIRKNEIHGAVIIIDEGGVLAPSEAFYEEWYKVLNQAIQVSGWLNLIFFWCSIIRDNIGSKIRKLFHMQVKCRRSGLKYTSLKVLELDFDDLNNKMHTKRPKIRIAGRRYLMNSIKFGLPPEYVEMSYRALTEPVKAEMMAKFAQNVSDAETKPKEKKRGPQTIDYDYEGSVKAVMDSYAQYQNSGTRSGRITLDDLKIKRNLGIPFRAAVEVKKEAERRLNNHGSGTVASTNPIHTITPSPITVVANTPKEPMLRGRKKLVARRMEDIADGPVEVQQEEGG